MKSTEKPTLITVPFAKDGNYNEIATKSTESSLAKGIATYQSGFPPLTMTAISAGGVPPSGKDMNGILNDITTAIRYSMSGGLYSYNADFSAAIDGYPKGAIVASSDGSKIWWNGVEDNNTDPDSTSVSGWKNLLADPNGLFLQKANNLSDINNKATARNNLGLGEIATQDFIPDATLIEKGITQLTDKTGNSNTLAATQKFVSDVNDNANNKLAKNQNGADIFNKTEFVKNIGLSETVELAKGAVPNSRKINGKPLTGDISLNAGDVGSYAKSESDNTFLRISSNKTATVGSLLIDSKTPFPKLRFKSKDGYILGINGSEGKLLHIYSDDPKNQRRYNILTPERSGTLALQNTAIKSENGWWQCGDTGVIIQWVKVPSAQQSWIKINYPISFKNKLFGYIASMSSINTSTGHTLVRNATLSTFEYQAGTPNNDENPGKVVHILFWGVQMVYFSRKECVFYNEAHEECVEITAEKHNELLDGQSRGFAIVSDKEGYPILTEQAQSVYHKWDSEKWIISESDKIKLRREQQQQAEHKKQQLMLTVSKQIAPLQDAVDLEMSSDEEKSLLAELKKYRVLLNRVDVNLASDINWPEKPLE